jgi:hypothetical protein
MHVMVRAKLVFPQLPHFQSRLLLIDLARFADVIRELPSSVPNCSLKVFRQVGTRDLSQQRPTSVQQLYHGMQPFLNFRLQPFLILLPASSPIPP